MAWASNDVLYNVYEEMLWKVPSFFFVVVSPEFHPLTAVDPPPKKKNVMRCVVVYRRLIYVPLSVRNIQLQHASLVTSAIVWGAATSFKLALTGNRNPEYSSNRQR